MNMGRNTIQEAERQRSRPASPVHARHAGRGALRLLTYITILFQISAFVLLALKTQPIDIQALILAAAFPLGTLALDMVVRRV